MQSIRRFYKDSQSDGIGILGIDPGSGSDILVLAELIGNMVADALLIDQKYAGRLKKICRNILTVGDIDTLYDYILLGGCVNHYSTVDSIIKTLRQITAPNGHIYATYSNRHVFDRVSNIFDFGSGKMLKVTETEYRQRSYIEFDEFMRELAANGLRICNMELVDPQDISQLEENIRRFTDNGDFILTVLDKVRYIHFELDIINARG